MKWFLTLNIDPKTLPTAQQKGDFTFIKNGKAHVHHYIKPQVQSASARIKAEVQRLSDAMSNEFQGDCGVDWFLTVIFVYALPKSYPRTMYGTYKRTRPDGDNMIKLLQDAITQSGRFWCDDSQVQIKGVYRRWQCESEAPRILVTLSAQRDPFSNQTRTKRKKRANG